MRNKYKTARFPVGAFALGIFLLSADMREAFISGILIVLTAALAAFLKNLFQEILPEWSLRTCLWIAAGAFAASVFELSFYTLGMPRSTGLMLMQGVVGILAAEDLYWSSKADDCEEMFRECAVVWALWLIIAVVREFLTAGTVFRYRAAELTLASGSFQKPMFAFLAAGMVLGLSCLILRRVCRKITALYVMVPAVLYTGPFTIHFAGEILGFLIPCAIALVFFLSVKKQQEATIRKAVLDGLPAELLAMGIIYMVLSIY